MLEQNVKDTIKNKFKELKNPIKLLLFEPKEDYQFSEEINTLLKELSDLGEEKISFEKSESHSEYQIENTPSIVLEGKEKTFIRYLGLPAGHEFTPFIQSIIDLSKGEPNISDELKEKVRSINFPVHMKVFVSPTCPYCPASMKVAYDFAMLNSNIKADVYEVNEFREVGSKYNVMGVPKTVINDKVELSGAYPPGIVMQKILSLKE